MILGVLPLPELSTQSTFNYTVEQIANSTNETAGVNVTAVVEKELEIDLEGTPPEVLKVKVNYKGNTTMTFT